MKGRWEDKAKTGRFGSPENGHQIFAMHNKKNERVGQQL